MTTTVTSKGQVTIPKRMRELLGIRPGSAVDFELTPAGEVVLRHDKRKIRQPTPRFAQLRGVATVKMSTNQIMALTRGPKADR
ncbi:MAG: AbrB/MazE/SpoVT family DNA-binding domain-containing protein [Burkholderiales bacterium]